MKKTRVCLGVFPEAEFQRAHPLFAALRALFPVDFEAFVGRIIPQHVRGTIVLGDHGVGAAAAPVPALIFTSGTGGETVRRSKEVEFRSPPSLPPCLRRQCIEDADVVSFMPLTPRADDEVVGLMDGQPFWLRYGAGSNAVNRVAIQPPSLAKGDRLLEHFRPGRFVRLLPLLQFIRSVVAGIDWDPGPLRACFVFDDPNLSRPRFGCLDFRELAQHAHTHGYHAAVAMVPLDAERTRAEVAPIFRENAAQLSLLMHGNNHTYLELLHCGSDGERRALLAQALRRIHAFERHHGLAVDRVMEAPHGVISRNVFPSLAAFGFESAMTTFGHMLHYQPTEPWLSHFGMDMAEIMPGGFATIPRILMLPNWRTSVVLAGFLRQPIVVAGHHHSAVDGLDFLAELSEMVAGFGPVRWLSPAGISRSNFKTRRKGACLTVRAYQRRISVPIPEDADHLIVERAWMADGENERLTLESPTGGPVFSTICGRISAAVQVRSGDMIEVRSFFGQPLDPSTIPPPPRKLWPVARRFLTETRDRCYPWLHRRSRAVRQPSRSLNNE